MNLLIKLSVLSIILFVGISEQKPTSLSSLSNEINKLIQGADNIIFTLKYLVLFGFGTLIIIYLESVFNQ